MGAKTHKEINEIAIRWKVSTIPFTITKLTQGVDHIKIYEYLALGLPVVASYMPQIVDYPYTYCYKSHYDFIKSLEKAMNTIVVYKKIEDFLSDKYWEDRVKQTMELINNVGN